MEIHRFICYCKNIFCLLCMLLTLIAISSCVFSFLEDQDIASIEYERFHSSPDDIYPSLSLCFGNILDEKKLSDYQMSKNEYLNFLKGHRDYWNKSWVDIEFEKVSTELMEHLAGVEFCQENINGELSKNPYLLYDNTIVPKHDNIHEWIPTLSFNNDPRYSLIQKCISLDAPFLKNEHLTWITLVMRKSVFKKNRRPKVLDASASFSINIHYPNQRLHFAYARFLWNDLEPEGSYGMLFNVFGMEVMQLRNKDSNLCASNWSNDDSDFKHRLQKEIGCAPPYGIESNDGSKQKCDRAEQLKKFYEMKLDNYLQPCRRLTQISYSYSEFSTNYYANNSVFQNLTGDHFYVTLRFLDRTYKQVKMVKAMNLQSLFGNAGGIVGILLGFSIMQIPALFQKIINYFK